VAEQRQAGDHGDPDEFLAVHGARLKA
jgi:hypothetical protein